IAEQQDHQVEGRNASPLDDETPGRFVTRDERPGAAATQQPLGQPPEGNGLAQYEGGGPETELRPEADAQPRSEQEADQGEWDDPTPIGGGDRAAHRAFPRAWGSPWRGVPTFRQSVSFERGGGGVTVARVEEVG